MADKVTPVGTEKLPENPALQLFLEREKTLSDKLAKLETADPNAYAKQNFDLNAVKDRAKRDLADIRKAIKELKK